MEDEKIVELSDGESLELWPNLHDVAQVLITEDMIEALEKIASDLAQGLEEAELKVYRESLDPNFRPMADPHPYIVETKNISCYEEAVWHKGLLKRVYRTLKVPTALDGIFLSWLYNNYTRDMLTTLKIRCRDGLNPTLSTNET